LLLEDPDGLSDTERGERRDFVLRFQQLTAPVMAKGLEDTAFYRHFSLASINEVGGGVGRFGVSVEDFHRGNEERLRLFPHGFSATSTHDNKRSEDVRARLSVLSEIPELWDRSINRWRELNRVHKTQLDGEDAPDANDEYLLYQTLVGAWPIGSQAPDQIFVSRIQQYMNKALKEAKIHTSWINPNEAYDTAVGEFITMILDADRSGAFLADFTGFFANVERAGLWNALSQTVLKIGAPGVPDFYQGTELWDFSLVDPDNRRPVDFELRKKLLASLNAEARTDPYSLADRLLLSPENGLIKMFVTSRGLAFRRAFHELFHEGGYAPLAARGVHADKVVAFARVRGGSVALIAAGRFFNRLGVPSQLPVGTVWENTTLHLETIPIDRCRDVLTDRVISVGGEGGDRNVVMSDVFARLPVAILEGLR
jgi:(1->4)-alpha-D-glucan 1-alpha-D-glucosylmutase